MSEDAASEVPQPAQDANDGTPAVEEHELAPGEVVVVPGLEDLLAWLGSRTPSIARAKIAQAVVQRIEDDVIDPAVVYAWEHRNQQATLRDLSNATGLNMARLTWALRRHPRSDT